MFLDLLFLAFITVFIIDYSGVIQSIEEGLQKWLKMPNKAHVPKPFSCSLCSTFWLGLIYLLCTAQFSFMGVAYVCFLSSMTPVINSLMVFVVSLFNKVFLVLQDWLGL